VQPEDCTLLLQDCDVGKGCYPVDANLTDFQCLRAGEAGSGAACEYTNDCLPGLLCMGSAETGEYHCTQVCALEGAGPQCPEGQECQDRLPDRSVGGLCGTGA